MIKRPNFSIFHHNNLRKQPFSVPLFSIFNTPAVRLLFSTMKRSNTASQMLKCNYIWPSDVSKVMHKGPLLSELNIPNIVPQFSTIKRMNMASQMLKCSYI